MRRNAALAINILATTTIITGAILASAYVSAENDVVDEINITVPISCTLSGTGMKSHNANITNGTYQANIGTTTLHAFCNDNEGFAIYAAGYTGDEIGGTNSNKLVGASTNTTIETGLATSAGNPDVSNWAMKLAITQDSGDTTGTNAYTIDSAPNTSGGSDASFSEYHVVPNEYTKVAHKNSATDMTANAGGVKLTTTYAAYISKTQPADTYTGQVIYTLVHPSSAEAPLSPRQATAGCINYFANASNALGTMGCQSATDGNAITLLASNFSRNGYGFAGWSDKYDYTTNQNAHFYGPQELIITPEGTTANGLALYAIWIKSQGALQDAEKTATLCGTGPDSLTTASTDGTANLSSVSALTDNRDNQTYAIAKLADGNCWMIENLRLDNTAELTITNTNNPLNDGTNVTLKHNYTDTDTYNTLSSTSAIAYDATTAPDGWCTTNSAACADQSRLRTDNTTNRATGNPNTGTGSMYSYGNYYNWYSATAGKGTFNHNSNNYNAKTQSVNGDLCPSGWKLPLGKQSTGDIEQGAADATNRVGGFSYLDRKMGGTGESQSAGGSSRWLKFPVNILFSSSVSGESFNNRGNHGYYWSSTENDSFSAYGLNLGRSYVSPENGYAYKYDGGTIRCIASS